MENRRKVYDVHPSAFCCFDTAKGTHKVYYRMNGVPVGLSGSHTTPAEAWADAVAKLEAEQLHGVTPLHEGDDGR